MSLVEKAWTLRGSLPVRVRVGSERFGNWLAPRTLDVESLDGFRVAQSTALNAVKAVSSELRPGWTEVKAAALVDTYLRDCGVGQFFHHSFAWYGERTRFDGIRNYGAFAPSKRVLRECEVYILDTAPIVDGFICDIGYTGCAGHNPDYATALKFLWNLRREIPRWALQAPTGAALWKKVADVFSDAGYEVAHRRYPMEVLGHRVHRVSRAWGKTKVLNFGLASYMELSTRLVWDQLLTPRHDRPLRGAWAIEPHLGTRGGGTRGTGPSAFGAKFEEILYITDRSAEWIHPEELACLPARQS